MFALLLGVVLLLVTLFVIRVLWSHSELHHFCYLPIQKGKVQFGYIYGVGFLGCISIYLLLKLMSETAIDFMHTTSVLGYCFLPIILLAVVSLVVELKYAPFPFTRLYPLISFPFFFFVVILWDIFLLQ